jgi:hypothetical protein
MLVFRHGSAGPGHLSRHSAGTGGPDEPSHDEFVKAVRESIGGLV